VRAAPAAALPRQARDWSRPLLAEQQKLEVVVVVVVVIDHAGIGIVIVVCDRLHGDGWRLIAYARGRSRTWAR
jgi:hypothetical protein